MKRWSWAVVLGLGCGEPGGAATEASSSTATNGSESGDAVETTTVADSSSAAESSASSTATTDGSDGADPEDPPSPVDWQRHVIYLVMPDRFFDGDPGNDELGVPDCFDPTSPVAYHGGDLEGLIERLDHLEALGVTALWTTPVYLQTTGRPDRPCPYHGYWADFAVPDDGAVEPRLGGAAAFDELLAQVHARGIVYVMDMVVNHAGDDARIVDSHPGWFHDEVSCGRLGDPVVTCPFRPGSPDFAQEQDEVADYLVQTSLGWLRRHDIDAIRMDTARHVEPAFFRDQWLPSMRAEQPEIFTVAEVFSDDLDELASYLDAGFDSVFAFDLRSALVRSFAGPGSVDAIASAVELHLARFGLARSLSMVTFVDNHDVPRFASTSAAGVESEVAAARVHRALVALFTIPGIPALYYGDEVGLLGAEDPDNRRDMPAWAFDPELRETARPGEAVGIPQVTFELTRGLVSLRTEREALASGRYVELWRQNGAGNPNLWVFFRGTDDDRLVVAINAGDAPVELAVPIAANGALEPGDQRAFEPGSTWAPVLSLGDVPPAVVDAGTLAISLPAGAAAIYAP